jgi:hypothetical protein
MGAVRRHSRLVAWFAIVALLGNVLAAAFCHPSAKEAPLNYPADLLGAFVICSGTHGSSDDKTPDSPQPCQICITVAALNFVIAFAVLAILFPAASARWSAASYTATFADLLRRSGLHSRAPPLPA